MAKFLTVSGSPTRNRTIMMRACFLFLSLSLKMVGVGWIGVVPGRKRGEKSVGD